MRERGMIFNSEMVRAIQEGRKMQTRRAVKFPIRDKDLGCELSGNELAGEISAGNFRNCPFGAVGDRLWVRETWMPDAPRDGTWADVEFYGCKGSPLSMIPERYRIPAHCIHRESWAGHEMVGWRPSIHMPRWASRITLEITGVRVERLKFISDKDAQAEGVQQLRGGFWRHYNPGWTQHQLSARGSFLTLWESIYGEGSWQANPFVWVIEFKRVESDQ